ncbi:MAG TPA: TolC family protein [Burkholderiales bacterium]|nr:TolC family protein [Burkholderiales bacterium]
MSSLPTSALRVAAAAMLLIAAGCALKSPPGRETLTKDALGEATPPAQWSARPDAQSPVGDGWLRSFNEPRLEALVDEALARNVNLRIAAAQVEQARASLKIAGGALKPAVGLLARGGADLGGDGSGLNGAVLTASWELDLWGRVRYGQRAASRQLASVQADYIYARQSIAALVAKGWFVAAESALQRQLARDMLAAAERLVELAEVRRRVGSGDEMDVVLAQANVQSYRDGLRQLDLAREQALRSLEALAGRYPAATLEAIDVLPLLPPPAAAGIPSELLERRPDVVAAERRVAAAFDRVQEAKTARLPKISLTAGLASITSELFVLQDRDNPSLTGGVAMSLPIFTGGALEGQVELRTAEQKRAVAEYAATGLNAFNEVETTLSNESTLTDRQAILERLVAQNQRVLALSEIKYRVGTADLRAVLNDQLKLYSSRTQLVRVQAERFVQRVNLHLALGGNYAS